MQTWGVHPNPNPNPTKGMQTWGVCAESRQVPRGGRVVGRAQLTCSGGDGGRPLKNEGVHRSLHRRRHCHQHPQQRFAHHACQRICHRPAAKG